MDLYSYCVMTLEAMYNKLYGEYIEYYNTILYRRDFDSFDLLRLIELISNLEFLKNDVYPRVLIIAKQFGLDNGEEKY